VCACVCMCIRESNSEAGDCVCVCVYVSGSVCVCVSERKNVCLVALGFGRVGRCGRVMSCCKLIARNDFIMDFSKYENRMV
jgi:hypothetical protein